jgi:hypothetical protein
MKSAILFLICCLSLSFAYAEEATVAQDSSNADGSREPASIANKENSSYVICRNERRVRTIRVEVKGESCKALYSKDGADDVVGRSKEVTTCYGVVNKIRGNLEKGPWKCKDVSPDRVSFTQE